MTRSLALLLTLCTGFTGLAYEVTWQRYLATLLGSHAEATAAVLAIFLGGLSLGYRLLGRWTQSLVAEAARTGRPPRLLGVYGLLEAAIGLYALVFPWLFALARALSVRVPVESAGLGFALDVLLCSALIGPPALLMGGTIPFLTQALARHLGDATRVHALVYGLNTVGAFAGALAAGFVLIHRLGLDGTLAAMGWVNLAAGGVYLLLGARAPAPVLPAPAPGAPAPSLRAYAAAALLLGFAMMALQTVLIRLGGLAFGSSPFTFSIVVAVFVLCIALGSLAVSTVPAVPRAALLWTQWGLVAIFALLYPRLEEAPYWAHALRALFRDIPLAYFPYHLASFLCVLAVLGLPVALSGATLPLIFDHLRRTMGELGESAGRLYSWNTVGSLLGALLGGYALLFWLDLDQVYAVAVAALGLSAALVTVRVVAPPRPVRALLLLAPAAALALPLAPWDPQLLSAGFFRKRDPREFTEAGPEAARAYLHDTRRMVLYDDDPVTSVAVTETDTLRSILVNGKSDSATGLDADSRDGDYLTTALLGLLPALFAERPERAFVVGYGTGVTAGELAQLDATREVRVAEISPAAIRAAPLFDDVNLGASTHPEVEVLRGDAYRALLRSPGAYDVIVSEPSNPWVAGVEMLYSHEFLSAARSRLRPGGVYVQWFHQYETDEDSLALVLGTFASAFEHFSVWYAKGPDLLLLGFERPDRALDLEALEQRMAEPDFAAALARIGLGSLPALLAHELLPLDVAGAALGDSHDVHTLSHPLLNHVASRAFFRGHYAHLFFTGAREPARVGRENSLLRRYAARFGGRLPAAQRDALVRETCRRRERECVTLLSQWQAEDPGAERLEALVAALGARSSSASRGNLAQLALLFEADGEGSGPLRASQADRLTQYYETFYHHAAPFRAEALLALWERCQPADRSDCSSGRAQARALLDGRDADPRLADRGAGSRP